jgi:hypothetical protein
MAFVEGFAALGSVPSVDESARGFLFKRAADCEFQIVHWVPRNLRTSDQKSSIILSKDENAYGVSTP